MATFRTGFYVFKTLGLHSSNEISLVFRETRALRGVGETLEVQAQPEWTGWRPTAAEYQGLQGLACCPFRLDKSLKGVMS